MKPLYVQIKCELGKAYDVADALIDSIEETSEVYSTSGDYDLLAKFYLPEEGSIGEFVTRKVQMIPGIRDTHTILAFRLFGARDSERFDERR
jgi:DNA-binding Lrp family transcriptional regulator